MGNRHRSAVVYNNDFDFMFGLWDITFVHTVAIIMYTFVYNYTQSQVFNH